jgi:putative alpha-1,2-mannosidase
VEYVNTLIGTAPFDDPRYAGNNPPKGEELYTGDVVPGAMALDGTVKLSPDTGFDGIFHIRGTAYRYSDSSIMGFSHTHHEYNRFANILFMPATGALKTQPGSRKNPEQGYRSRKDAASERATPGYYTVFLTDPKVKVELTATRNAGFHRYRFPKSDTARVLIDLSTSHQQVLEAHIEMAGNRGVSGWQKCKGYTVYFQAEFNKPFASAGTWKAGEVHAGARAETGTPIGAFLNYATADGETVLAKVGISFTDLDSARKSLAAEIPGWDFDATRQRTEEEWNAALSRVEVEGGTAAERVTFYSSLYRVLASEYILGWPLHGAAQTIVRPEWVAEKLASNKWTTSRGGFWGPSQAPWTAGMLARGFRNFDVRAAYAAFRRSATEPKVGWERVDDYLRLGYIPSREPTDKGQLADSVPGGGRPDVVNRTLGYAYEDYAIAQIAQYLGLTADYEYFLSQAGNYRLLFDPTTGFMRGRGPDGAWVTPFDPATPYGQRYYREGTAWHYLWLVPHDVQGLIGLLGGRAAFVKKLDEFFATPYNPREPMRDVTGVIGQYVHGNETDRQAPYYYNYAGAPWKTQEIVRRIMRELYQPAPAGLCGMDDNSYLTGWYVFSAMGFYPVEPASGIYVIGSPVFPKLTLHLPRGEFVIEAHGASERNIYIQSATLNGKPLDRSYLDHAGILRGGRLTFEMGPAPNREWAVKPEAAPPSLTPNLRGEK